MASMQQQKFYLQRETVPGVASLDAMRDYAALKTMPSFNDENEVFRRRGSRGLAANTSLMESATVSVESPQCFNGITPVLASVLGLPVTTQPAVTTAPTAFEHVFTLTGRGERAPVTFTGQWGDSDNALQLLYLVFQSLNFGVQRSSLTFETSAIAREPDETATLVTTGITTIPAKPIPSRAYDVFMDDTEAAYGTTKMLKCYDLNVSIGDIWAMDTPINSAIASFDTLVENEDIEYTGAAQLGFNATARALIATFKAGTPKYVRIAATGPIIEGTTPYSIAFDFPIIITTRGEIGTAPNSPTVVLPFNYELTPDPSSDALITARVVNALATV